MQLNNRSCFLSRPYWRDELQVGGLVLSWKRNKGHGVFNILRLFRRLNFSLLCFEWVQVLVPGSNFFNWRLISGGRSTDPEVK